MKYSDSNHVEWGANTINRPSTTMVGGPVVDGYSIEVSIPWSGLGVTPAAGVLIGFDIGVNDDNAPCSAGGAVTRDGEIRWSGTADNYQDTSKFGELLLQGAI